MMLLFLHELINMLFHPTKRSPLPSHPPLAGFITHNSTTTPRAAAAASTSGHTQAENTRLEELLLRRKSEVTVLTQKKVRLEQQLTHQEREAKALRAAGDRLQVRAVSVLNLMCFVA